MSNDSEFLSRLKKEEFETAHGKIIAYDVEQGSADWYELRAGRATSSEFHKILTKTGQFSKSANKYANALVAEFMLQRAVDIYDSTPWMERGKILESAAADFYSMTYDVELKKVGFVTTEDGFCGCSQDRLIMKDGKVIGSLEIKCPSPEVHMENLTEKKVDKNHWPQLQGTYFVTGVPTIDIISYHPEMPPVVLPVERDEQYINKLAEQITHFKLMVKDKLIKLVEDGHLTSAMLEERGML